MNHSPLHSKTGVILNMLCVASHKQKQNKQDTIKPD